MSQNSDIAAAIRTQDEISAELRRHSRTVRLRRGLMRFVRTQPVGTFGALICVFLLLVAAFADWIQVMDPRIIPDGSIPYQGPNFGDSWYNWGSDYLGRDVFSRVVAGAQLSLIVSFSANFWGTTLGIVWGMFQGYWGGSWFDTISQRFVEALLTIPSLIMALTIMAVLGPSLQNIIFAIGLRYVGSGARTVRSSVLSVRENVYVDAARAIGASNKRILFLHIFPQVFSIYLILLSLHVGGAIIAESSLSFLGMGAGPDEATWGGLVTQGTQQALYGGIPWLAIFPGAAIALTVYGFNLFGDALRDTLDPRLRGSR